MGQSWSGYFQSARDQSADVSRRAGRLGYAGILAPDVSGNRHVVGAGCPRHSAQSLAGLFMHQLCYILADCLDSILFAIEFADGMVRFGLDGVSYVSVCPAAAVADFELSAAAERRKNWLCVMAFL